MIETSLPDKPMPNPYECNIETGSYIGTGKCGSQNPNRLTFNFVPKCVIIYSKGGGLRPEVRWSPGCFVWTLGVSQIFVDIYDGLQKYNYFTISGNTLSWYTNHPNSSYQANDNGTQYGYVAFG